MPVEFLSACHVTRQPAGEISASATAVDVIARLKMDVSDRTDFGCYGKEKS